MTKPILYAPLLFGAATLAILSLSACGKSDTGPKTMDQAKEEAAKLERPKPGLYSQSMTISKFEIPGAPPEVAEAMRGAMAKAQEHQICLTSEMTEQGYREMFDKVGGKGECKYDRFDVSGGRLDAVLKCANAAEGQATITLSGTVSEEGSDVNVAMDQQGGQAPMANTKIAMHLVTKRIGDCSAAK